MIDEAKTMAGMKQYRTYEAWAEARANGSPAFRPLYDKAHGNEPVRRGRKSTRG